MKNKQYIQWIWASTLLFLGMVMLRDMQIRGNAVTPNQEPTQMNSKTTRRKNTWE